MKREALSTLPGRLNIFF